MSGNPDNGTNGTKRKWRKRIGWGLLIAPLIFLPLIRLITYWTAGVELHYGDLLAHLVITVLAVMGVHILVEELFFRSDEQKWLELSLEKILNKMKAGDEERLGVIIAKSLANEWERTETLVEARQEYGLERIYSSRKDVESEILDKVKEAKNEVWLLGITFSRRVVLEEALLREITIKLKAGVDVKILVANAIRSLAVFRAFLEGSNEDVKQMMEKEDGYSYYFDSRFYTKFQKLITDFNQNSRLFQKAVRFYGHSPSCWMVRVDSTCLYYQPYILGRIENPDTGGDKNKEQEERTIGDLMPVFKFVNPDKKPFRSLVNHFEKLWSTSDADLFHIGARLANKDFRLQKIFNERGLWFKHIVGALRVPKDRRNHLRKPYRKDPNQVLAVGKNEEQTTEAWMRWKFSFSKSPLKDLGLIEVKMEDVSYGGCSVRIDPSPKIRELFQKFTVEMRRIQSENQQFKREDVEIYSYKAQSVKELREGFVTLEPPDVIKLKELDYLVKKMRKSCGLEFTIQNWNWDDNKMEKDLLIGMRC